MSKHVTLDNLISSLQDCKAQLGDGNVPVIPFLDDGYSNGIPLDSDEIYHISEVHKGKEFVQIVTRVSPKERT